MGATLTEAKKLTADPGVHYLANLLDELNARVDACCGGTNSRAVEAEGAAQPAPSAAQPAPSATEPAPSGARSPKKKQNG